MRLYTLGDRFNLCGERVREARMRMGWSQEELAAKLQLAGLQLGQMAVSRIETGKRVVPDFELPILGRGAAREHGLAAGKRIIPPPAGGGILHILTPAVISFRISARKRKGETRHGEKVQAVPPPDLH